MKNIGDLKKELKELKGSLLLIGSFNNSNLPVKKIENVNEVFYLNGDEDDLNNSEIPSKNVASNMHLRDLHKYFKDGVDNIYCNFDEIESHIPSFIRESLRITKRRIYIVFKNKNDYKKIEKKYKRYNLECNLYSFDKLNIAIIDANDLIIPIFKGMYYYLSDRVESIYNKISENI